MCHEKSGNGCEEDENTRRSVAEAGPCPTRKQRQEVAEAEENSGVDGRDKGGEQERQRIGQQQDTQAVVRSGCLRLHSRDGINFMDYSGLSARWAHLAGLLVNMLEGVSQRGTGDFNHSLQRSVHLENEKDRTGQGQRADEHYRHHREIARCQQAIGDVQYGEPEDQNH